MAIGPLPGDAAPRGRRSRNASRSICESRAEASVCQSVRSAGCPISTASRETWTRCSRARRSRTRRPRSGETAPMSSAHVPGHAAARPSSRGGGAAPPPPRAPRSRSSSIRRAACRTTAPRTRRPGLPSIPREPARGRARSTRPRDGGSRPRVVQNSASDSAPRTAAAGRRPAARAGHRRRSASAPKTGTPAKCAGAATISFTAAVAGGPRTAARSAAPRRAVSKGAPAHAPPGSPRGAAAPAACPPSRALVTIASRRVREAAGAVDQRVERIDHDHDPNRRSITRRASASMSACSELGRDLLQRRRERLVDRSALASPRSA